jgi:hypothetical protein
MHVCRRRNAALTHSGDSTLIQFPYCLVPRIHQAVSDCVPIGHGVRPVQVN